MLIPRRVVRAVLCVALVLACSWTLQQEWSRPYERWRTADRPRTPYGQWSRCFEPDAFELYAWLASQAGPNLIVVSNFHEYITLETKIPALPIPLDRATLNTWIDGICTSREVTNPRVLFVLDPDNRERSYWLPDPSTVIKTFALTPRTEAPGAERPLVFDWRSDVFGG
jgi:hypothetical protein